MPFCCGRQWRVRQPQVSCCRSQRGITSCSLHRMPIVQSREGGYRSYQDSDALQRRAVPARLAPRRPQETPETYGRDQARNGLPTREALISISGEPSSTTHIAVVATMRLFVVKTVKKVFVKNGAENGGSVLNKSNLKFINPTDFKLILHNQIYQVFLLHCFQHL